MTTRPKQQATRRLHARLPLRRSDGASRRGGYVYLAVLFTSLIVTATVAAALSISTASLRNASDRTHRATALRFAESELHRIAAGMRTSGQWRTGATDSVFSDWYPINVDNVNVTGNSQLRYRFTDPDGQLDDDNTDAVELTIHAKVGNSQAAITVTLEPDPEPFDFLKYSVTATDDIQLESGGSLSCEGPVQVDDDCKTGSSGVLSTPQLECGDEVQITLRGDLTSASITTPSVNVLSSYTSRGTQILAASIPQIGGDYLLEDIVLSATSNPFGSVDPAGIYWIDANGDSIRIANCRLAATLAIRDASTIEIGGGICWRYPTEPDAILISDARIHLVDVETTLDENDRDVNFNPPTSPYLGSQSNSTSTDIYPTELRGVIYTTSNIRLYPLIGDASLRMTGALFCRDLRIDGHWQVSQLNELSDNPMTGMSDPTPMRFVRGTQRRIPSPQ